MVHRGKRGSALLTAIFFTLVMFFFATVLTERISVNLRFTHHESDRLRKAFLAKAAVNEFLVMMSEDPALETATEASPHRSNWDGYVVESWLEQDPDNPEFFHIRGRAHPAGRPTLAEHFTRVVKRPEVEAVVYANSPDLRLGQPDSMFYYKSTEAEWKLMPLPPKAVHDSHGNIRSSPDEFAENLMGFTASNDGYLYGKYNPILEETSIFALIVRRIYERATGGVDSRAAALVRGVDELFETSSLAGSLNFDDAAPVRYNIESNSWETLEPIPNEYYDESGNLVRTGKFGYPGILAGMAANDDYLYATGLRPGVDSVIRYDIEDRSWSSLPPAPNTYYDTSGTLVEEPGYARSVYNVALDGDGTVYSQFGKRDQGHAIFSFDETTQEWSPLPPIPKSYWDANGNLVEEGGLAIKSTLIDAGDEGEIYAAYFRTMDDPNAIDTMFKLEGGQWVAVRPPHLQTHQSDGTLVTETEADTLLNLATVDSDGALVAHYRRESDYDRIYRESDNGFQALPRLPKQGYDRRGNTWEESGFFNYIHVAVGGGMKHSGGAAFVSTATY